MTIGWAASGSGLFCVINVLYWRFTGISEKGYLGLHKYALILVNIDKLSDNSIIIINHFCIDRA